MGSFNNLVCYNWITLKGAFTDNYTIFPKGFTQASKSFSSGVPICAVLLYKIIKSST